MYNQMYHETINFGLNRREIIIDAAEIMPGRFEVLAMDHEGSEIDSITVKTAEELRPAFADLLDRLRHPIQAAFYRAALQPGQRYTFVSLGEFGLPVARCCTLDHMELTTYAQYEDAVKIVFKPAGARKLRQAYFYGPTCAFLIYAGWRELPEAACWKEDVNGGRMSKYGSFDHRFIDDIKSLMPDCIAAYDQPKAEQPEADQPAEPQAEEKQPIKPYEFLKGVTVMQDEEHDGVMVDMSPEMFAFLYGSREHGFHSVNEKLIWALFRASVASMKYIDADDGGTCNFDSPLLNYSASDITRNTAEGIIKGLGFTCSEWHGQLCIDGIFSGQGNRRTAMAREFSRSLNEDGFKSSVYYQMD